MVEDVQRQIYAFAPGWLERASPPSSRKERFSLSAIAAYVVSPRTPEALTGAVWQSSLQVPAATKVRLGPQPIIGHPTRDKSSITEYVPALRRCQPIRLTVNRHQSAS